MIERPILNSDSDYLHRNTWFVAVIFANGSRHCARQCSDCDARSAWYSKRELLERGVNPAELQVVYDHRQEHADPCDVCGSTAGVELHHWAPQSLERLFREPAAWPTALLCTECHSEWHRIVTPDLVSQGVTLEILGARRSTTLRQIIELARERLRVPA